MFPKRQFDSTLGGDKKLPYAFKTMEFVASRSQEISALSEAIENPQRVTLVSQRLPKHMQRRIMSHNAKRMPTALRKLHSEIMEKSGSGPLQSKRPRRKYRRRPQNLMSEYNRRQREFVWLETHIWHAKRFHMINKWGYRLPHHPNDKSYRACYRASTQHCLLQDVSYYVCVEIRGGYKNIIDGFSRLTDVRCGLTFAAKYTSSGKKEGSTVVYKADKYPYGMIGVVKFLWKPSRHFVEVSDPKEKTIWVWIHPAHFQQFMTELKNVFVLKDLIGDEDKMDVDGERIKPDRGNITTGYTSDKYDDIHISVLKDMLNRFRLVGPLSQSIITDAFHLLNANNEKQSCMITDDDWINDHYRCDSDRMKKLSDERKSIWSKMKMCNDPSQLPSRMVLPLIIRDPRFNLPNKRTKAVNDVDGVALNDHLPIDVPSDEVIADNPLWDLKTRKKVSDNKLSTSDITRLQSDLLVPGTLCEALGDRYDSKYYLPVAIIRNDSATGIVSGWDIVLPSRWAMPIWLSLVWRGARVGGLRETTALSREAGLFSPIQPDSDAGDIENEETKRQLTDEYFRKPPAKRPNYTKLGVRSPFFYPWRELLRDWNNLHESPSSFFVLRDKNCLNTMDCAMKNFNSVDISKIAERYNASEALVGVSVKISGRGDIKEHSSICLPTAEDLQMFYDKLTNKRPIESTHKDPNEQKRSDKHKQHLNTLKKLTKKRKKLKMDGDVENLNLIKKCSEEFIKQEAEEFHELWLPNDLRDVKNSSDRKTMGFVTNGDYCFSQSCGYGLGYVTLTSLLDLIKFRSSDSSLSSNRFKKYSVVLIRTPSSYQYSFAIITLPSNS